mgnify:CR=1 FL=1
MSPVDDPNLLNEKTFEEIIETYGSNVGWEFDEIDSTHAVVSFEMESDRTLVLYITNHDDLVEFDIPTDAKFMEESEIPGDFSIQLLKRNSLLNYGLWTVEEIEGDFYYSLMYNEELKILRTRTAEEFAAIVDILLHECDEVESLWLDRKGR